MSDIHSNMEAFEACLERARDAGFDSTLCCGDIVGYGPEPNEAVEQLRRLDAVTIRGNHDRVACGQDEPVDFNPYAKAAALWTRNALSAKTNAYLRGLAVGPLDLGGGAQLVHGAVTHEDDYIMSASHAAENFAITDAALTFFGHSHFQCVFSCNGDDDVSAEMADRRNDSLGYVSLEKGKRYMVNPGSVGQPRDGDRRGGFAIWDDDAKRIEFYRVEYDVETTQKKMLEVELPQYLIDRLTYGR